MLQMFTYITHLLPNCCYRRVATASVRGSCRSSGVTHLRCAADAVDALEDAAAVGIAAGSGAVADDIAQRSASVNRFVRILVVSSLFSITPDKIRNNKTCSNLVSGSGAPGLLHGVGMAGRRGGGAGAAAVLLTTELEGQHLLDAARRALDDRLGDVAHGAAQGRGRGQVGRLWGQAQVMLLGKSQLLV